MIENNHKNKVSNKSLVIYYSLSGNTRKVAEKIATYTDSDLYRINLKKELSGFGRAIEYWVMNSLVQASSRIKEELINFDEYNEIYIGTPVWGYTYSTPLKEFFKKNKIEGKKIHLFATHDGGLGQTFKHFRRDLKNNNVNKEFAIGSVQNVNDEILENQLRKWIKD